MSANRGKRDAGWTSKLAVAGFGVLLSFGLAEAGLRAFEPGVPSLAAWFALDERDRSEVQSWTDPTPEPADCRDAADLGHWSAPPRRSHHGPGKASQTLWVAGDSLVHGWGVAQGASWPEQLADQLVAADGRSRKLSRLGGPGLGFCGWVRDVHRALDAGRADLVLLQVFADDLEHRRLVRVRGHLLARPDHPLLWHSFLANRLWFAWLQWAGDADGLRHRDRRTDLRFRRVLRVLVDRLDGLQVPWHLLLVAPAGFSRCAAPHDSWGDCDWLSADLKRMADLLADEDIPFFDLRGIEGSPDFDTLPDEEQAWTDVGRLPIHPGPRGHRRIANEVALALGIR